MVFYPNTAKPQRRILVLAVYFNEMSRPRNGLDDKGCINFIESFYFIVIVGYVIVSTGFLDILCILKRLNKLVLCNRVIVLSLYSDDHNKII